MDFRAAFLLMSSLTASVLTSNVVCAAEPAKPAVPAMILPKMVDVVPPLPNSLRTVEPSILLPPPSGEAVAVTRSASTRRAGNPDADLTVQLRRWQGIASSAGMQPYTWGVSGDVTANLALGLQSTLFYTDNVNFVTNDRKKGETIFELSPVIKLDIGDPQAWMSGTSTRLSEYYASLLYVPTFYYHLNEGIDDYAQHFLGELGRVNEKSRTVLRLEYDERILASSENTSPEENYTMLDASMLEEYRFSPRTTLRGKATYRKVSLVPATANRDVWIGEMTGVWELSPKTKLGLGTELGHIVFDQVALGTQDYQQAFFTVDWKPSPKFGLTSRTGMEWRQFNRTPTRGMMISLVTNSALFWQISEKTRINARLRVHNEPSVIAQGSLYRAVRFGPDILHDFSLNYYSTVEFQMVRRHYDSGRLDWEPTARLALGYRDDIDKAQNRLNIELFIQWHRRERNDIPGADLMRTQAGVQVTKYF